MTTQRIHPPLSGSVCRSLSIGNFVELTGIVFTARDMAHHHFYTSAEKEDYLIPGSVIYHCGPVALQKDGEWQIEAAGPTTSKREEPYMATLIERYSLGGIIGKGGMGPATLAACREFGCCYFHAIGGAAQVLANCIQAVKSVRYLEAFGLPEAVWELSVVSFPAVVTMDSQGNSLHKNVARSSETKLQALLSCKSRFLPGE